MSVVTGCLRKMRVRESDPVEYELTLGDQHIPLNPHLGQNIWLRHTGKIQCVHCDKPTNKSFSQGYCYPCFKRLPECDTCIMNPEQCHFHLGTCRDSEWGSTYCMQTHYVYLANTSGLKVGITRDNPVSTRWIDQGAIQARVIARVSSRRIAGLVEATLRQFISDRTQWQRMLKGAIDPMDLVQEWADLYPQVADKLSGLIAEFGSDSIVLVDPAETMTDASAGVSSEQNFQPVALSFPVQVYPEKIKSFNFDKTPEVSGELMGIKGQYLILDSGVINLRKFSGYEIQYRAEPG
ncbi:MAG: DUF2797 domain-containing protein [Granulosicoccus sp.]|nr:DUF2797 domain-containing protein [Granulosicoccus sp.]